MCIRDSTTTQDDRTIRLDIERTVNDVYKGTLRRGTWTEQSRSKKPLAYIRLYSSTLTRPSRIENQMTCIDHYALTFKESLRIVNRIACLVVVDRTVL